MDPGHKRYLQERLAADRWQGRGGAAVIKGFAFAGDELPGWTLLRARREERDGALRTRALWHRGDPAAELLSLDVWECASLAAAHDRLLEALGNTQSAAVRRQETGGVGDVGFALGDGMALFARSNMVVWIRNAGPRVVEVSPVARALDRHLVRLSGTEAPRR